MALPPSLKGHRLIFTDSNTTDTRPDAPLHTLELYLDYVCPFSAKMFNTLVSDVLPHIRTHHNLASKIQIIIRPQIQPWHPTSTLVHEAALAVQRLTSAGAGDRFWAFLQELFKRQEDNFDEAVVGETRNQTYRRLALLAQESAGVNNEAVYQLLEVRADEGRNSGNAVTGDVKTIVKMARLTGVHATPTVLFNGVVAAEIESKWTGEEWEAWLDENIV